MSTTDFEIRAASPSDWRVARDARLEALADAPDAFGSRLADEQQMTDAQWQARVQASDRVTFMAFAAEAAVGLIVCAPYDGRAGAAGLFSMWVAPQARGQGVGDRLVQRVLAWARAAGYTRVLLDVGDENVSATRLYERNGFLPTGRTGTLPPPREHVLEHEREHRFGPN